MSYIFLSISAFITTYLGVGFLRRWALKKKVLDIPNERSSHSTPTPKGGGLIIVIVCLSTYTIYHLLYGQTSNWSYLAGALLIALISWLDDLIQLPVRWRFLCHLLAALIIVWQIGYWSEIYIPWIGNLYFGRYGLFVTLIWIIWLTNAYNFMDGIDGLAAIQALTAALGWFFVGWFWQIDFIIFYSLIIFCSSLGFLMHNWHPARIFMGDVGSAFLGYTFAVMPLLAVGQSTTDRPQTRLPLIAILLVWLFVFDTAVTLLRRLLNREKIWTAHRQHLYQKLVSQKYSHSKVTILYGLLSFLISLAIIYSLFLDVYEVIVGATCLIATITLVLLVYDRKLLTKDL